MKTNFRIPITLQYKILLIYLPTAKMVPDGNPPPKNHIVYAQASHLNFIYYKCIDLENTKYLPTI